jgi:hypothetical protein
MKRPARQRRAGLMTDMAGPGYFPVLSISQYFS